MEKQLHDIGTTGPKHRSPLRRRRRLGASAGALVTGAALVLGSGGLADGGVHEAVPYDPYPVVKLHDNCETGFTGEATWKNGTKKDKITVTFTPPPKQPGKPSYVAADLDLRGDYTDPVRKKTRVFRMRHDFETLDLGKPTSWTFYAPSDIVLWRISVGAAEEGPLETEVHALEAEKDPAACD